MQLLIGTMFYFGPTIHYIISFILNSIQKSPRKKDGKNETTAGE